MLAHHTVGGCPFNVGDLMASGTVSGTESRISGDDGCSSFGALIEINEAGKTSIELENGEERRFLEDGDTVTFTGVCGEQPGALVGFGTCSGTILPAVQF
jgi:fumarylacetoacetase